MCDTLVVVQADRVLFAKNSDRDPNEGQALEWFPRRRHPRGARLRCTWAEIPQVAETAAVLISRPFWGWGAEMGTNEHGVTIGNEAVFTRQTLRKTGLTGMDLLRLALERARGAAAAVGIICELIETVGQGVGAGHENRSFTYHNSFLVADAGAAFVLETADRRWAVERVSSGIRSISNILTIPAFAERYSDRLKTRVACAATRLARTTELGARATQPADLMRVLRDHGRSMAPTYTWHTGGLHTPCVHAGGMVASSQTTASWVAELKPDGARHWATGTAAPCTGLFKPISAAEPVDLGPAPTDRYDERTVWWRHERLHRVVMRQPDRLLPELTRERDALEAGWLADPRPTAQAWEEADRFTTRWTERLRAASPTDERPWWVRRYWRIRDRRAGLFPGETGGAPAIGEQT